VSISVFHISANQYPSLPATHHTRRIWAELARDVDEYHVFARANGWRYERSTEGNTTLHLLPAIGKRPWVFFFTSWALPFLLSRHRATHLVAQCPVMGGLAASVCAKLFGLKLVVELHGSQYFEAARPGFTGRVEHWFYRALSGISFRAADRIRTYSEDMQERLLAMYGRDLARKAVIVPTRVDLAVFNRAKEDYAIGEVLKIATIGSLAPRKNHLELIRHLHRAGVPFRLTIIGSGPLREEYVKECGRLGIGGVLVLTGNLQHGEMAGLLVKQDLYVHYALSEGMPRAILEAMACGLPVISNNAGFLQSVLRDGTNALVLSKPSLPELRKAIETLAGSAALRERLGRAARQTIEAQFNAKHVFDNYRKVILCET
jgi:glycosyltransferase involved in cell wall biosynthesis